MSNFNNIENLSTAWSVNCFSELRPSLPEHQAPLDFVEYWQLYRYWVRQAECGQWSNLGNSGLFTAGYSSIWPLQGQFHLARHRNPCRPLGSQKWAHLQSNRIQISAQKQLASPELRYGNCGKELVVLILMEADEKSFWGTLGPAPPQRGKAV